MQSGSDLRGWSLLVSCDHVIDPQYVILPLFVYSKFIITYLWFIVKKIKMADGSKADGLGLTVSYVESLINGKQNVVNRILQPTGGDIYLFNSETGTLIALAFLLQCHCAMELIGLAGVVRELISYSAVPIGGFYYTMIIENFKSNENVFCLEHDREF